MTKVNWDDAPDWATEVRGVPSDRVLLWSNAESYSTFGKPDSIYRFGAGSNYKTGDTELLAGRFLPESPSDRLEIYTTDTTDTPVETDKSDAIKNPKHYQILDGVESIEIIARSMTVEQWHGFCLGNIIKYRLRAGNKDKLEQDIGKTNFYKELFEMHKDKCIKQ